MLRSYRELKKLPYRDNYRLILTHSAEQEDREQYALETFRAQRVDGIYPFCVPNVGAEIKLLLTFTRICKCKHIHEFYHARYYRIFFLLRPNYWNVGLGVCPIASYEWMAAVTLLIVGKYLLPIFIEKNLFTIPEFIEHRFNTTLKTILAVFWIGLFVFVNLTTVMFLGAKALDTIMGTDHGSLLIYALVGLAVIAAAYSLYGGLSAVAWTGGVVGFRGICYHCCSAL